MVSLSILANSSKYIVLFLFCFFGGPISSFVSSSVAFSEGLNIYIVYLFMVLAEVISDIFYYSLGRYFPKGRIDVKIAELERNDLIKELNRALAKHPGISIFILKATSVIAGPVFSYIGRRRYMSLYRYIPTVTVVSLMTNGIISFFGYSAGMGLSKFKEVYSVFTYASIIVLFVILIFFVAKVYRKKVEVFVMDTIKRIGSS